MACICCTLFEQEVRILAKIYAPTANCVNSTFSLHQAVNFLRLRVRKHFRCTQVTTICKKANTDRSMRSTAERWRSQHELISENQ